MARACERVAAIPSARHVGFATAPTVSGWMRGKGPRRTERSGARGGHGNARRDSRARPPAMPSLAHPSPPGLFQQG